MADDNRGWHGDAEGHAMTGSQSSGNQNAGANLSDEDRAKGGSMSGGNFKNRPEEEVKKATQKGGSMSGGNFKNRSKEEVQEIARKGGQS